MVEVLILNYFYFLLQHKIIIRNAFYNRFGIFKPALSYKMLKTFSSFALLYMTSNALSSESLNIFCSSG
ncbi:MAG: hypothetical protein CM15mP104_1130 [Gammaproteobacteria bacterium]|nr:MAG: hypothetical protein CM15mP104_1130 [Gammaproteobacteria bacterium]